MHASVNSLRAHRFGVFEVDLRAAELRKHGIRIKLQEQPFQLLALLLEHPGELVTRDEIRQALWPARTFVDFDRSLNKAMTKLRSALGDCVENPRYIETVPRHGYRFLVPLNDLAEAQSAPSVKTSQILAGDATVPADPAENAIVVSSPLPLFSSGSSSGARKYWLSPALVVSFFIAACGVLALGLYVWLFHPITFGGSSNTVSPRHSVAVLGFKNLSRDAREGWLSTALSDWLSTELTAGDQLRTIPAESIARMKIELSIPDVDSLGRDSLARIRKNIGTDLVVVGSYAMLGEKSGGQIRLDLCLQDTRSGETIDAISERGTADHLLDLVSGAGEHLRAKLGVRAVTPEEAAEVATALPSNSEAARFYSEGLNKLRVFDALTAHDLFLRAVAAEPNYALSHTALASAWAQLGYDGNAKVEAKKAFDLSANLPRAERLLVEGRYRETSGDWGKAIEIYQALFEFFPDNLDYGLALVGAQVKANRWKDALDSISELRKLPLPLRDDPRIDWAECDPARSLGDMTRAEAALVRAAEKARAAGASLLLARVRLDQGWLFENLGRLDEVEAVVDEAKQLYIAAHDRRGVASATSVEAIVLEMQGNYLGAKKRYEEALAICQEMGSKLSVANEYDNIGDIFLYLGDLAGARKSFEQALATYREIGDQDGEALAKNGLADVFLTVGKHTEAGEMFAESLEICRRIGDRSRSGVALSGLARALRVEGDIEAAQKKETEARAIFEAIGDKSEVAQSNLHLAELFLDQGKSEEAALSARRAADVFEKTKATRDEAAANLVLSRALLVQKKITEAQKSVDQTIVAARESHNRELEMFAAITAARIRAASGNLGDSSEPIRHLRAIVTEATATGFVNVALEARLAVGEVEMASGNQAAGRPYLEALEKDAMSEGFQLMARKAAAALRVATSGASN